MLLAEYVLQNLCFAVEELKLGDNHRVVAQVVQTFIDVAQLRTTPRKAGYDTFPRYDTLSYFCSTAFKEKDLTREQVKQTLDFAKRTVFKHLTLIHHTFLMKRTQEFKMQTIVLPEPQIAGSLSGENCREIVEPKVEDDNLKSQQDFYQDQDG